MASGRVQGKVALVTGAGASPGLGSATAVRLAEEGASVILADIDHDTAEARAAEIRALGGKAAAIQQDVTSDEGWDRTMATVIDAEGRIDILVNNAGIVLTDTIDMLTPNAFAKVIETNLTSVYLGTRRAVAEMRKTGEGGAIVNISSMSAVIAFLGLSAYAASKAGVLQFTKSIALETASENIRVNSVLPGIIWTTMQKKTLERSPEFHQGAVARVPMGRLGDAIDIANSVLFLASEEAQYITGVGLLVDGGMAIT